jgi:hypothetical protein
LVHFHGTDVIKNILLLSSALGHLKYIDILILRF